MWTIEKIVCLRTAGIGHRVEVSRFHLYEKGTQRLVTFDTREDAQRAKRVFDSTLTLSQQRLDGTLDAWKDIKHWVVEPFSRYKNLTVEVEGVTLEDIASQRFYWATPKPYAPLDQPETTL